MAMWNKTLIMGTLFIALAGCHQGTPDQEASSGPKQAAVAEPKAPPANADDNTWGEYLAAKAKIHVKDATQRPYSYVIPPGDNDAARSRRQNEAESIAQSVGHILIPGSLLIIGGPDPEETNHFVAELPKTVKAGSMASITVLVISDGKRDQELAKALEPTGATVRFASM